MLNEVIFKPFQLDKCHTDLILTLFYHVCSELPADNNQITLPLGAIQERKRWWEPEAPLTQIYWHPSILVLWIMEPLPQSLPSYYALPHHTGMFQLSFRLWWRPDCVTESNINCSYSICIKDPRSTICRLTTFFKCKFRQVD